MKVLQILAVGMILGLVASGANADDKKADNAKLVVGKWAVTKCEEGSLPVGTIVDLTKDGKVKVTVKEGDKEEVAEGTYTVDGDTMKVTLKVDKDEEKHTVTIKKVSDTEMIIEADGKTIEFKKKTPKGS